MDFLLFGYDQGVTGGLLTLDSFRSQFPSIDPLQDGITDAESSNRSTYQGITVASYNVGCFLGAVLCIWIGSPLGRRKTLFLGTAIMVISAILQTSSYSVAQFIISRIITGIGNSLNTSTVPTWQSECLRSHRPFIMSLPESPRWLVLKEKDEQAMHVLAALNDHPVDSEYILNESTAIKDTVLEMEKGTFKDLFTMGPDRHSHQTILAYVNQMFQQISGINLITRIESTLAKLIATCNGTEYFLASWVAVFTVERFDRRQLMLFGAAGMSLSMVALSICDSIGSAAGIGQTVFLFVFNIFFAIGWLGMTWLYPAEIVPLQVRAPENALVTSGNWLFNFMVVMITPVTFSSIGYKTYVIFAVINAFIFPVVYFFYPETAYRSLEMDNIFPKTKSIFTTVKAARDEPRQFDKNGELLIKYEEHKIGKMRRRLSTGIRRHLDEAKLLETF
ncbi:sugar porter family MFS transporter [Leptodontidium sp. MPI-SDFR-AT-0119]|nr:sugar porter family MFS transporter [Leptodontidium sp. MPI-SDFR-AT-0119]